jgi:hypothetical protein
VLTTKRQTTALLVLAFFSIAVLCAESSRLAARSDLSINARANEKGHAPVAGQRKALKRAVYVEEGAPPSDSARTPSRYLSSKQRRVVVDAESRRLVSAGKIHVSKVSTNLFLSVLNL